MQKQSSSLHKIKSTYESNNENVLVIYEGSKNLWRQRLTIDIYIIQHSKFHTLEVVCFLPHSSIEVPRVYISFPALAPFLDKEEIEEKCNARKEFFLRQRKQIDNDSVLEKVTEDLAVAFIISKLDLQSVNAGHGYQVHIESKIHKGDAHTKESFFCAKPHNLEPLVIKHNAVTSSEDFKSTLQKFREDSKAAKSHNEKAFHALHPGVEGIEQVLAMKLQHDREIKLKYSPAKCRWIHAINKIVIQNYVAKVRQRLADMNAAVIMRRGSRKANTKRDHRTLDNSVLEQRHSESLPSIASDSSLTQRAQSRIKRYVSRKDSSQTHIQRKTYDADAPPTYFPNPISPMSCQPPDTMAACSSANDKVVSPPSILHSYREKSLEMYSSMKSLSIPWLIDSDDDRSIMSHKRTVLRPIAPISPKSPLRDS